MKTYISGERLQELAELTIVFSNQLHVELTRDQLPNTVCKYIIIYNNTVSDDQQKTIAQANSIFVYTHALPLFFQYVYPEIKHRFTLLTHNSDHPVSDQYRVFLSDDKIIRWFCQNRETQHKKLLSLPIGLANSQWPHGNQDLFHSVVQQSNVKQTLVFKNFDIGTNTSVRTTCDMITRGNGIPMTNRLSNSQYWELISKSMFCISPPGGGIDCHRIWECLYLKTVPIILKNEAFVEFTHLPILMVDSWEQVTIPFLQAASHQYKNVNWKLQELDIGYWSNKIKSISSI